MADRSQEPRGTPRIYELIEHVPKEVEGKSPTIWAWPQVVGMFKVAGQPVPGPWPPHQEARPDPESESIPVAIPEQRARPVGRSVSQPQRPPQSPEPPQHGLRGASEERTPPPERGRSVSLPRRPGSSTPNS